MVDGSKQMQNGDEKTRQLAGLSILSALIVVLQVACNFIKLGPVSITLALAPIIIGAAIYEGYSGAILGFVLGVIVLASGIFGWDGGFVMYLFNLNPIPLIPIIFLKSTLAGHAAQKVYEALRPKGEKKAVLLAGIVCPVVNTGIFLLGMFLFWKDALVALAGGQNLLVFAFVGLAGINFLVELGVNVVLSSTITYIIKVVKRGH